VRDHYWYALIDNRSSRRWACSCRTDRQTRCERLCLRRPPLARLAQRGGSTRAIHAVPLPLWPGPCRLGRAAQRLPAGRGERTCGRWPASPCRRNVRCAGGDHRRADCALARAVLAQPLARRAHWRGCADRPDNWCPGPGRLAVDQLPPQSRATASLVNRRDRHYRHHRHGRALSPRRPAMSSFGSACARKRTAPPPAMLRRGNAAGRAPRSYCTNDTGRATRFGPAKRSIWC
jgi:hypothetical protein